jgi:hypothetical protein
MAYLGCAAALGYGVLKLIWSLGGTAGLRDPEVLRASLMATSGVPRFFDYWGTPILAGLAVVILLGLVYPWGNVIILRPLLRTLAWAGSLVAVAGVAGLILVIRYSAVTGWARSSPPPTCSSTHASWCSAWHSA